MSNETHVPWTVGELKAFLADMDDGLPVTVHIVEWDEDGEELATVFPVEAAGTDSESISLACYDT